MPNTERRRKPKLVIRRKPRPIKNWVTSHELFLGYRYRQRRVTINPNTGKTLVFQPYISVKESSNHDWAMQFPEWESIIKMYWDIVTEELTKGNTIVLSRDMGRLVFYKSKCPPQIRGNKKFMNSATFGYKPVLSWHRNYEKGFKRKMWYQFNLSRGSQWAKVGKELRDNPSIIFKYQDNVK